MGDVKKIAVIGVGSTGLSAIKSCLEENFQVIGYERTDEIGGLWRYKDQVTDGQASVMKSTVINTSKDMNGFSDFPPPADFPNFMHNSILLKYLHLYAEQFDLLKHIRFNHEILKISRSEDYSQTGRWRIKVLDRLTNIETEDIVDGVMICTGHHALPKIPKFPGIDDFTGKVIHSHSYRVPDGFEDKNVLVVGIGNSGVDVAVELGAISKKVYMSTRRGAWVIPRRGPAGKPFDFFINNRLFFFLHGYLPGTMESVMETYANFHFNHKLYDLKPKHRILNQHPTLSDLLCVRVLSGTVVLKGDVKRFTKTGVVFIGDESKEYPIDVAVLATGYFVKFPFLEEGLVSFSETHCDLYKFMFPPHLEHPSLAFIGMIQPIGSIFPISELQGRWFCQLMKGNVRLPSKEAMQKDIKDAFEFNKAHFYEGWRHVTEVVYIPFMDFLADQFGAKPSLKKLILTDWKLFWNCIVGPCVPYQYRLNGPHSWPGARHAILTVNQRMQKALKTRVVGRVTDKTESRSLMIFFLALAMLVAFVFYLFQNK